MIHGWHTLLAALLLALVGAGCNSAQSTISAQRPGIASGAGATLTGPTNAATPTTQKASRAIAYAPPVPRPTIGTQPELLRPQIATPTVEAPALPPPELPAAMPLWVKEEVETQLGQHQDAAGIVKAAAAAFGLVRWLGIVAVVLGVGGLLHAAGNQEGYPMVWVLTTAVGGVLLITGSIWVLFAALLPLGLYAGQKFGLLRIPPIP